MHCTKSGFSIYPIKAGNVLSPKETLSVFNKKIGSKCEHRLFIWVLRESSKLAKKTQPKHRRTSVIYFWQPVDGEHKRKFMLSPIKWVQRETIAVYLRKGYDLVATGVTWHHKKQDDAIRFYRAIGVL